MYVDYRKGCIIFYFDTYITFSYCTILKALSNKIIVLFQKHDVNHLTLNIKQFHNGSTDCFSVKGMIFM